ARIRDPLSIIPHDVVEDDPDISMLRGELRAINPDGEGKNNVGRDFVIGMIKSQREKIVGKLYYDLLNFINSLGIDGNKTQELRLESTIAIGAVDWLTRHTEDREYYQSVYQLCRMHKGEDYEKGLRGGPFQKKVMETLGVNTNSLETTDYFAMRDFYKLFDRVTLAREREPRFEDEEAKELEQAYRQNEWLKNMYGENVNFRAENMPGLYVMKLLYRNYIVLNNVNLALNEYGNGIVEEKEKSPAAHAYLLGIIKAREMLLEENVKMAVELRHRYESSLGEEKAAQIREEVDTLEGQDPLQFEVITGEGPISRGSRYDPMPRRMLWEMDRTEVEENYKDAIGFEKLQQRFLDPARNYIDARAGVFRLFSIDGLTDKLSVVTTNSTLEKRNN
ncbi:MAG: hypothetical protein AABX34_01460, partial [Nanoarchaeota archaeon]